MLRSQDGITRRQAPATLLALEQGALLELSWLLRVPIVPLMCSALLGRGVGGNSWLLSQNYLYPLHLHIYIQLEESGLGAPASCCVLRVRQRDC